MVDVVAKLLTPLPGAVGTYAISGQRPLWNSPIPGHACIVLADVVRLSLRLSRWMRLNKERWQLVLDVQHCCYSVVVASGIPLGFIGNERERRYTRR